MVRVTTRRAPLLLAATTVVISCLGSGATVGADTLNRIDGTTGDDVLVGTGPADDIHGLAGADTIYGLSGGDVLAGDEGDDLLFGGSGTDQITGGAGTDDLRGNGGWDSLYAEGGDVAYGGQDGDRIEIGSGAVRAFGDDGGDTLAVTGAGRHVLRGGLGDDSLANHTDDGSVQLHGGPGADLVSGPGVLHGNDGADELLQYTSGTVHGDAGNDYIVTPSQSLPYVRSEIFCDDGEADEILVDPADVFGPDCESVRMDLKGTDGPDVTTGTSYDDRLYGSLGRDVARLLGGDDLYLGYAPDGDVVYLGEGDDRALIFNQVVDEIHCGPGSDEVADADPDDIVAADCETVSR